MTAALSPGNCGTPHSLSAGALVGVEQGTLGAGAGSGVNVTFSVSNGTLDGTVPSIDLAMVTMGSSGITKVIVDDDTLTGVPAREPWRSASSQATVT